MAERRIFDVLNRRSFRTLAGYGLFALLAIIPVVEGWKRGTPDPVVAPAAPPFPNRGFGVRSLRAREPLNSRPSSGLGTWVWRLGKPVLAAFGTTLAMLILIPFSGCKRYALLFGPPAGFMASVSVSIWLWGRSEVYRIEPGLAAVVGALPAAPCGSGAASGVMNDRPVSD